MGMTLRLLALSDIHDDLYAAQVIRRQEPGPFNAVVFGGDIGKRHSQAIFDVLASFGCPVLYIFGNWDRELNHDQLFAPCCHHLHLSPISIGNFTFVGLSDPTAPWQPNARALSTELELRNRHKAVLNKLKAARSAAKAELESIAADLRARLKELEAFPGDKRRLTFKAQVQAAHQQARTRSDLADRPFYELQKLNEYVAFQSDWDAANGVILDEERSTLAGQVQAVGKERSIVVTHDRLAHTSSDLAGVPLFLFGHRHRFSQTTYRGSQFVNISVAGNAVLVRPANRRHAEFDEYRNLNTGNYVIIELRGGRFQARPVPLPVDSSGWERVEDMAMPYAPWTTE
jgi:predicted phosphodiesterase